MCGMGCVNEFPFDSRNKCEVEVLGKEMSYKTIIQSIANFQAVFLC